MTAISSAQCAFHDVTGPDDPDCDDFVRLYEQVALPQDFVWVYRGGDIVRDLWNGNAGEFIQTARGPDGGMVGYVCCHPLALDVEPKIGGWIREHDLPFPPEKAVVISYLAVHHKARGAGIGTSLGYDALRWAVSHGFEHFLMQANTDIARKPNGLCFRIGARTVAKIHGEPDSNRILLLYGDIRDALACDECSH